MSTSWLLKSGLQRLGAGGGGTTNGNGPSSRRDNRNDPLSGGSSWGTQGLILAETFERHWLQLREIAAHNTTVPTGDDVVAVLNLLDQMTSLLQMELEAENEAMSSNVSNQCHTSFPLGPNDSGDTESPSSSSGPSSLSTTPCVDLLLSENVLSHTLAASRMPVAPEHQDAMRYQQLKLYETLLSGSSDRARSLMSNQSFLRPLLDLLNQFAKRTATTLAPPEGSNGGQPPFSPPMSPTMPPPSLNKQESIQELVTVQTETHLVLLLDQLCSRLMERENAHLLDLFFNGGIEGSESTAKGGGDKFPIFTILVGFLHSSGVVGQNARDALLLCMSMSKKHHKIGKHIATNTNFCPLLATGLSGLYSLLPRRLDGKSVNTDSNFRLTHEDVSRTPELENFLSSLEFCDAVIQVAHPAVRQYLLGLIYMGFLVPVLGPALTQTLESELICSTAYVELFLRRISEPSLLAVFLRFIFTDTCDDKSIIDTLIQRIGLQSQLCTVTLTLFETLVGLNCEDVMLWLVFRHLIPMNYLLPSQRETLHMMPDIHGRGAQKLLSLVPICCTEASSNSIGDYPTTPNVGTTPMQIAQNEAHRNGGQTSTNTNNSLTLPTFLVGITGPSVQDGVAPPPPDNVDLAINALMPNSPPGSITSNVSEYHSYLVDARNAVRQRSEATKCWLYQYDGRDPPMHSAVPDHRHQKSSPRGKIKRPQHEVGDILRRLKSDVTISKLSDEEDIHFWEMMNEDDDQSPCQEAVDFSPGSSGTSTEYGGAIVKAKTDSNEQNDDNATQSLGPFLELLLEKVELMPTNSFATNLLVTGLLSQLASYPQPLLKSVLIHPDVVVQPSIRSLFTAIASLRQKLDIIMPTFPHSEEAIQSVRKHLADRVTPQSKRGSNVSLMSTAISQIGQEVRASRNTLSAAFSGLFGRRRGGGDTAASSGGSHPTPSTQPLSTSASVSGEHRNISEDEKISSETKQYAMAAVILEEWLHELAAIATEQSVLQREQQSTEHLHLLGSSIESVASSKTPTSVSPKSDVSNI